jgi:hypothetical protein
MGMNATAPVTVESCAPRALRLGQGLFATASTRSKAVISRHGLFIAGILTCVADSSRFGQLLGPRTPLMVLRVQRL